MVGNVSAAGNDLDEFAHTVRRDPAHRDVVVAERAEQRVA